MKLTNKAIEDVVIMLAGEDITPLVYLLKGKNNFSEFKLAERMNITVNQVRNMLYRLHKHNLVFFTRKKDKKKGWYIYYWTLNMKNIKDARFELKKKQLIEFKNRLDKESSSHFFVCPNKCSRLTMENALEVDFRCQECGSLMGQQDNQKTVENVRKRIVELEAEIKEEELERAEELQEKLKKAERAESRKKAIAKKISDEKKEVRKQLAAKKKKALSKKKVVKKVIAKKKVVKKVATKKKVVKKKVVKKIATKKKVIKKSVKKKGLLKKFKKILKKKK
ncbi:MAG: hypothetical protein KKB39_05105 [Nanoarchaeota archaeon]|nr:hypothetical protein [Nanoarchaeota archaeon]